MKIMSFISVMFFLVVTMNAQDVKQIKLPSPDKTKGTSIMKAFNNRHSERTYAPEKLSQQDLSDLLWAANGINRPDGKRTAPSCRDFREVGVYVILPEGAYLYDEKAHALTLLTEGDYRSAVAGGQDFVKTAPVNLVYVADYSKMGKASNEDKVLYSGADVGFIAQNVYLFCASENLSAVIRASIKREELSAKMKLNSNQKIILSQTIGFPG